jgi:hypothetical protein
MSDMNVDTMYAIASQYDIPAPPEVIEAKALLDAAERLRNSIAAEIAPDLGKITRKTLTKAHTALVDYENRDARLRAADTLVTVAARQAEDAKFTHHIELEAPLAEKFNAAAERFVVACGELGGDVDQLHALTVSHRSDAWREMTNASLDLQTLSTARDAYAPPGNRADVSSTRLEELTRIAVAPNREAVSRAARPRDAAGWADLVSRGFVLRWQTRAAQEANEVSILEHARATHA